MTEKRKLHMEYAGNLVKHLGIHLYSTPVPAIAELIANCWDADASIVDVIIPTGHPFTDDDEIIIKDNGIGLSFKDCNSKYLVVGRERRIEEGDSTDKGRKVMGRKGLGKLAGFGIAEIMEVRTVKEKWVTHFRMDYKKMVTENKLTEKYEPQIIRDEETEEESGTTIILKQFPKKRAINEDKFMDSMGRRFAVLSDSFVVTINNETLQKEQVELEFRWPEEQGKKLTEEITGAGTIEWWIGTTKKPIPIEEARGISVFVRGKQAQTPFFFDLSGGFGGQLGIHYMTGEIYTNFLDEEEDLIATGRQTILWDDDKAILLKEWAQKKILDLLMKWKELRSEQNIDKLKIRLDEKEPLLWERIQSYIPRKRKIVNQAIKKLASISTITEAELYELVRFILNGVDNSEFIEMITEINRLGDEDFAQMMTIFQEWDIIEAINLAQVVRGRLQILLELEKMIDRDAGERCEFQTYLEEHPWIFNPQWDMVKSDSTLKRVIEDVLESKMTKKEFEKKRVDFFCLGLSNDHFVVVEIKGQKIKAGEAEFQQVFDYIRWLENYFDKNIAPNSNLRIEGLLVAREITPEGTTFLKRTTGIDFKSWRALLKGAFDMHHEYFQHIKNKAPSEDPRIRDIEETVGQITFEQISSEETK